MAALALLALHARRSRAAIVAWRAAHPERPLIVVLTGTDLYRDVPAGDAGALASLADADRLIVLQGDAPNFVPATFGHKVDVVFQSARPLKASTGRRTDRLHCILVAHLRDEKDPHTAFDAWRFLPAELPVTLTIIGAALDPALGEEARALAAADPRVRWLGPRPHAWTRQAIKRAHLLLCPSKLEGGANVVAEAVTAGTPVLASRMSGNVGMLGDDYAGYFPVGDAGALARLVTTVLRGPLDLQRLVAQCAQRSPLFTAAAERSALEASIANAITAVSARTGRMSDPARGHATRIPP